MKKDSEGAPMSPSPSLRTLGVFTSIIIVIGFLYFHRSPAPGGSKATRSTAEAEEPSSSWREADLTAIPLPDGLKRRPTSGGRLIKKVEVKQETRAVAGVNTFVQSASPPPGVPWSGRTVLLLHGAAFNSQTWVTEVPTIATLAAAGHKVVALDLPGYGRTPGSVGDRGGWLEQAISTLSPGVAPVLVSPSMSGGWAVPLLADSPDSLAGWVPVAPGAADQGRGFFPSLRVPTLIVYGEKDTGLGVRTAKDLVLIPTATKPQVLPGARHPAYLDQPDLWHQLLINFIALL